MQGPSLGDALPQLGKVHVLLTFVLRPAPETYLWCDEIRFRWIPGGCLQLEFWYAKRKPPMKPMSPPRRRVVRRRMFGGNGSAISARALFYKGMHRENFWPTPQVQGSRKRGRRCSPCRIVRRSEITNDTREMRVCVDERVGRLHDLVRHGDVVVSVKQQEFTKSLYARP